ncbi:MAG TPA: tRNA (adenine-N1)-methyltransferase [candidate division WOR-3 bacterium]|uniref:tRNA (adenine(58)-N(1))-methyltransferase TrmI n=1 Tax=candidate division WOR-3 bacterium TaxID=2052148 RepID=A0A7V0T4P3_UNCW3|nr:tRNA (adenine-N1)-methyltransferase [candidate division WOR-3 bacterium]
MAIQVGDFVYVYHSEQMKYLVQVPAKGQFSTHRGHIEFGDIVGRELGDEIRTHMGFRFHLLKPVLADLAMKVSRQTTIVYPKDAGVLLMQSLVQPGMRVIETGSGSGALSIILASIVRPEGRVYSYERRPEFSALARQNVKRYGLEEFCEFFVADPEHGGFGQTEVDTVMLDVPEPWSLLPAAHAALRGGFPLAAIVPTVEQVRRTTSAMELTGFGRIRVQEILERHMFVRASGIRPADRMVAHTVYIITGQKVVPPAQATEEPSAPEE